MDTPAPIKKVGHLPPKKLALVAVVGIGGGLLWRKFSKGKASGSGTTPASTDNVDLSQLALAGSSTGNLGAGTSSGGTIDTGTTRDVGSITLPVVKWVITIGGKEYLTDGTNIEPLDGGGNVRDTVPVPPQEWPTPFDSDGPSMLVNPVIGQPAVPNLGEQYVQWQQATATPSDVPSVVPSVSELPANWWVGQNW